MSDKMMRISGVYLENDDSITGLSKAFRTNENGKLLTRTTEMEVLKLGFRDINAPPPPVYNDKLIVNDTREYVSESIDLKRYKKLNILVHQNIRVNVGVRFTHLIDENQDAYRFNFFDWNTDSWLTSTTSGDGAIVLPRKEKQLYSLATHPNFYHMKELGDTLQVRFKAHDNTPVPSDLNTIEFWLVGEYFV